MRRGLLTLIMLAGCVRHLSHMNMPATAAAEAVVGWAPVYHAGEQLEFSIAWHHVALAKLLELEGDEAVVDGRRAAMLELRVDGDGLVATVMELHDRMRSVVDLDRGVPIQNDGTFEALFRGWGGDRGRDAVIVPWTR